MGLAALAGSLVLTRLVRRWARAVGFVDQPGHRKVHREAIALGGGVAVFWVVAAPIALVTLLALAWGGEAPGWLPEAIGRHMAGLEQRAGHTGAFLGALAAMHVLGLVDDRRGLGPWSKLAVQLAVAVALVAFADVRMSFFIDSIWVTGPLTVLWIGVIVNAFNFLDNMDGLSAGVAAICCGFMLYAALAAGQVFVAGLLALMIGALAGFLVYNFNPASIFLGDGGSLVVGLVIATATVRTTYYHEATPGGAWYATLMPLVVLAVPLYDFLSVTLIRLGQGRSPFVGDTQHFSHRLRRRGMTTRQAVLTIWLATACTGMGAAILTRIGPAGAVLVGCQTVMIVLIIAILEKPGSPTEL